MHEAKVRDTATFALALGSALFLGAIVASGPVHAQTSGTTKPSHGVSQYHGIRKGKSARVKHGTMGMSHGGSGAMKRHTNQQTGAAGTMHPMSHQKANQAKTAPKTQ
ncbi:MAG: hypothetical protein ACYCZB_10105 [Acidiphilium sp.]